jgi:hypothetical protein
MKYWNKQGQHQDLYDKYWETLVPNSGEADTPEGEALRAIGRIYYDVYNNGAYNICETEEIYDDDGNYEYDDHTISLFYEDFFDTVASFTGDHHKVRELKRKVKDLGADYWHEDLGFLLDDFTDKILQKIDSQLVAK